MTKKSRETIFHSVKAFLASCFCTHFLFFALSRLGAFEFFLSPITRFNGVKSKLFHRCEAKEDPRRYKFHKLMMFYHLLRGCEGVVAGAKTIRMTTNVSFQKSTIPVVKRPHYRSAEVTGKYNSTAAFRLLGFPTSFERKHHP